MSDNTSRKSGKDYFWTEDQLQRLKQAYSSKPGIRYGATPVSVQVNPDGSRFDAEGRVLSPLQTEFTRWEAGDSNLAIAERLIPEKNRSAIAAKACRLNLTANKTRKFKIERSKLRFVTRDGVVVHDPSIPGSRPPVSPQDQIRGIPLENSGAVADLNGQVSNILDLLGL